jgi:hypothetical protein
MNALTEKADFNFSQFLISTHLGLKTHGHHWCVLKSTLVASMEVA